MNKKKITTMLLVVAAATSSLLLDNTNAFADNHSRNNKNNIRSFAVESSSHKGKVINVDTNLRVRKGPSTSDSIIGYLRNGQIFDILGRDGSWYKIKYEGKSGYIHKDYVKELNNDVEKGKVVNITSVLTLRKEGSTKSKSIGYLRNGQTFDILGREGSWYKIKVDGKVGYVYGEYVKVIKENNSKPENKPSSKPENKPSSKPSESIKTGKVVNITSSLTVRKDSSTKSKAIGYLKNGEKLQVVSKVGSWYKIKYKGGYGYVYGEYVKIVEENNNKPENKPSSKPENKPSEKPSNKFEGTGKVINITSNLRVRKGPGTNYGIAGYMVNGDTFDVLGKEGSWYKIKKGSLQGYVSEDYVKFYSKDEKPNNKPDSKPNVKPESTKKYGRVNVSSELRIREKPSTNSKIIGNLRNGEIVEILGEENGFYKIKDAGITGYSSKEYIKKVSEGDINNNITPDNGTSIHTNYHMSMSSYIKLQQKRVSSYSYDYFEKYINPNKASNIEQFLRLDEFRNVSVSKLNSYLSNSGILAGHAKGFVDACKKFDIDPIYFIAQSIHETGHGKSKLAMGVKITEIANPNKEIRNSKGELIGYEMIKLDKPVTVYNLFGIGAYDNSKAFPNRALILGTTYAYTHGWTSVDKAIEGAAKFVSDNYINSSTYKQNTLYKMRFIPNVDLIWHQYATTPWYAKEIGDLMHEMRGMYSGKNDFVYDMPKFN